jgi:hypothetical protein
MMGTKKVRLETPKPTSSPRTIKREQDTKRVLEFLKRLQK